MGVQVDWEFFRAQLPSGWRVAAPRPAFWP